MDPRAEAEIKKRLREIENGEKIPRPDMLGLSREARQTLELQQEVAQLHRVHAPGWPVPKGPVTPGELIQEREAQAKVDDLFADILKSNPAVFGVPTKR